jgi:CheY-like chemotaxis protein/DNA-binding XRE family transcriptional regulator
MFARSAQVAFGEAVRQKRLALHISQEELAYRSGLHRTYISDVERGARNLSLQSIEKLAQALELSVSALFSGLGVTAADQAIDILLVEDNARDAEMTLRAFRKARITNAVHVVPDGAEALEFFFGTGVRPDRVGQSLPGLILLDLNLPKVDGIEVLRRIKGDKRTKHIPVIVLTASNRDGDIATCRRLGAASYIVKPVGFQNFSEVVPHLRLDWALKKAPQERGQKE